MVFSIISTEIARRPPVIRDRSAQPILEVASWENEGGSFQGFSPSDRFEISQDHMAAIDALAADLKSITSRLSDDLANGRVGLKHNTYEHRSRVIRQTAAKLAAARILGRTPAQSK